MNPLLLPVAGIVLSVAALTAIAASYALTRISPTRRRLADLGTVGTTRLLVDAPSLAGNPEVAVKKLAPYVPKSPKEMGRVQRRLATAGFH